MVRRGREAASTVDPADLRRLPTRVGSAARSGFVGSWLILGSGFLLERVLRRPHNAVGSPIESRRLTPDHHARVTQGSYGSWLVRHGLLHLVLHLGPEKADELARDGDDGDLRSLSVREIVEALM